MRIVAYLDPGSGSMIASAVAAGFAGIAVVFKVGFRRVFSAISPKRRKALAQARASAPTEKP